MSGHLAAVPRRTVGRRSGLPLIVAVDLEGSTKRTNPVKGELRRVMYELLDRALQPPGSAPASGGARPIAATACCPDQAAR